MNLPKGENSGQEAWYTLDKGYRGPTVLDRQVYGPKQSYNNIMDANGALETIIGVQNAFPDHPSCVIIKHQNPCGIATGETLADALNHAWKGDPISAYGGIIAFNRELTMDAAKKLNKRNVDVLLAPKIDGEVLEWLDGHKNHKNSVVCYEFGDFTDEPFVELRAIRGGSLYQTQEHPLFKGEDMGLLLNPADSWEEAYKDRTITRYGIGKVTDKKFHEDQLDLLKFTIVAGRHSKSNCIVVGYEYTKGQYRLLGSGYGQCNRVEACQHALDRAEDRLTRDYKKLDLAITLDGYIQDEIGSRRTIAFSDAFTPKLDVTEMIAARGIQYFAQPGGSVADEKVVQKANELGVAMLFTGARQFKH